MTKFVCRNCNYRFESQLKQSPIKCPYCDKTAIIKEPGAQELLDG